MTKRRFIANGLGMICLSIVCLVLAGHGVFTGKLHTLATPAYLATSSTIPTVSILESPRAFWVWIVIYILISIFGIFQGGKDLKASQRVTGEWLN